MPDPNDAVDVPAPRERKIIFVSEPTNEGCEPGEWKLASFYYRHFKTLSLDEIRPTPIRGEMTYAFNLWCSELPRLFSISESFNITVERAISRDEIVYAARARGAFDLSPFTPRNEKLLSLVTWPPWNPEVPVYRTNVRQEVPVSGTFPETSYVEWSANQVPPPYGDAEQEARAIRAPIRTG